MIWNVTTWRLGGRAEIDCPTGKLAASDLKDAATKVSCDERTRLGDIITLSHLGKVKGVIVVDWHGKATLTIKSADDVTLAMWSSMMMMDHHSQPGERVH